MIFIVLILLIAVGIIAYGAANISSGIFVKAICKAGDGEVLLTFDDGPDAQITPRVLDVLKRHGVHAIFFCTGQKAENQPDIVKRIVAEGHTVGNHTYRHNMAYTVESKGEILDELRQCHLALQRLGIETTIFRPPLGVTNDAIAYAVKEMNYKVIGWSIRSLDTSKRSRDQVFARVQKRLRSGSIVLLHDRMPEADALAERIINEVKRRGLRFAEPSQVINNQQI